MLEIVFGEKHRLGFGNSVKASLLSLVQPNAILDACPPLDICFRVGRKVVVGSARKPAELVEGKWKTMTDCFAETNGIVISSERLTDQIGGWTEVAPNRVVTVDVDLNVDVRLVTEF